MRIKAVRIQNFRSFKDETIHLDSYACLVGPNGSGKSTVLAALNVFFREQATFAADVLRLSRDDFFRRLVDDPIRITVTFRDLNAEAASALAAYARNDELQVIAEATLDSSTEGADVVQRAVGLGIQDFRPYFEALRTKQPARTTLDPLYADLVTRFPDLPQKPTSKDAKAEALRTFEAQHPDLCTAIEVDGSFYENNGGGLLNPFVQWIYVPAVKNVGEEGREGKKTGFGKLMTRALQSRTACGQEIDQLRRSVADSYKRILDRNQDGLKSLATSLKDRLATWAHPDVSLDIAWHFNPRDAVAVSDPAATVTAGDDSFSADINRMGHGLQRSYLLALLQELAGSQGNGQSTPSLILGCEEPELYQHPPQARHLAATMEDLAEQGNQVVVTTHSPLFVSGQGFEHVRLVSRSTTTGGSEVRSTTFDDLCERVRKARGESTNRKITGLVAKLHQTLQPGIAEMFFARLPILVEGLEDLAFLTSTLQLSGKWPEFRRFGCQIIPVNGKDKLIQPLAIARSLGMPVFVVFDSDGAESNSDRRTQHAKDNRALQTLLGRTYTDFPADHVWGTDHVIWKHTLTAAVDGDFAKEDLLRLKEAARIHYAQEGGLDKHELFIADWMSAAHGEGKTSPSLNSLCDVILAFAQSLRPPISPTTSSTTPS